MNALKFVVDHTQTAALTVCVVVSTLAVTRCQRVEAEAALAAAHVDTLRTLNDSTKAILAQARLDRDKLAGLQTAAEKELHGKLIAGLEIRVPARDTLIVHDTIPTQTMVDSTRIATFRDSTFAGTIEGTITAPPYPAPLATKYQIHRPPFEPKVGFVQVGARQVAVVVWQGEQFTVDAPFSRIPVPDKRLKLYAEAWVDPVATWTVDGGAQYRAVWGLSAFVRGEVRLEVGQPLRGGIGLRKDF